MIDGVAGHEDPRVLAVAAGHLREAELSTAVSGGALSEYVAFDQDEASLAVVARDYAHLGITPRPGSVRQILAGKVQFAQYDFVYAAGLYDYLSAPVACALTRRLFDAVRPGGTLLVPNFLKDHPDVGYMESFMDWHLVYRDHADMQAVAAALPSHQVSRMDIFNDPDDTIVFLLVEKAGR